MHHTLAETLGRKAYRNEGLRRTRRWSCRDGAIDPKVPTRLLLFALDAKLGILGGFS